MAAAAIWQRFVTLVGENVTAKAVGEQDITALRGVGLSARKAEYILGIVSAWPHLKAVDFDSMTVKEVSDELLVLRGIGPWTIDMVCIFTLLKPDILPLGDVGVVRMIEKLYNDGDKLSKSECAEIGEKWAPYRTVAAWYLWRGLDPEVGDY
jgi:DNA-3-methyladenine glycosylase II